MGNALGCAGLGERLAAAARDGDAAEVRRLLAANPGLARCAAFGSLNSPLHLAAAKGHHEIAASLLENGADVNARNIYGQTALMQACRFGHWEVVQTLLVFRCNVFKVDSLSSRTALHLAAAGGHVKCARLLLASAGDGGSKLVSRAASGGVTALHLAALNGHADCVHLLIDERADVAAGTLPCAASPMASIGAGSTPLHYAAAGGEVKCCQILVSRGADRTTVNCNGQVAPGGRGQDMGMPLAGARAVPQVSPAHTQVPALRLPLVAARHRAHPRKGLRPGSEHYAAAGGPGRRRRRRRRRLRGLPRKTLHRRSRSVRARAVRQVRAGPVLGDQVLRRAGDRRHHPLPALPERHRLLQETGRAWRERRRWPAWRRRPPGVVQPGEETEHGFGGPGQRPRLLCSYSRRPVLTTLLQDAEKLLRCIITIIISRMSNVHGYTQQRQTHCLVLFADRCFADGIGGF